MVNGAQEEEPSSLPTSSGSSLRLLQGATAAWSARSLCICLALRFGVSAAPRYYSQLRRVLYKLYNKYNRRVLYARRAIGGRGTEEISEWLQGGFCIHDLHACMIGFRSDHACMIQNSETDWMHARGQPASARAWPAASGQLAGWRVDFWVPSIGMTSPQ